MRPRAENADGLYAALQDYTVSTIPQHQTVILYVVISMDLLIQLPVSA